MLDIEPIPLVEPDTTEAVRTVRDTPSLHATPPRTRPPAPRWHQAIIAPVVTIALCTLHGVAIWWGLGGQTGLTNGWPLWRDDHPLYYHSALVTRAFLKSSWTTAGYDPSFMAGYPKSIVFPSSSTLPELAIALFGGDRPDLAYKLYVLTTAATVPWLVALACFLWRLPAGASAVAVLLDLVYLWTDFPINYVTFGMLPYFVAIPIALVATGAFARFLRSRQLTTWIFTTVLMSLAFLSHLTIAMVAAPAAALAYIAAFTQRRRTPATQGVRESSLGREVDGAFGPAAHLAVWVIPIIVLLVNAFWWLPGIWWASTKGTSDFAFAHAEGVFRRLLQIGANEAPIQSLLWGTGLPGLYLIFRRDRPEGVALIVFCGAGVFWGYLAGGWRALDFLQPGRHTYACYTALAVAAGAAVEELRQRIAARGRNRDRLDRWILAGACVVGIRLFAAPHAGSAGLIESVRSRLFSTEPFLSSRPSPRLLWVIERVKRHVKPGERLLYEEGGFGLPGVPDPFQRGRFSGILPERTGVEVIGGPYLHASLTTNFTQFGEGKLFGKKDWGRDDFLRHARLYRPSAILCWTPHARRFCSENPDLVKVLDDDGAVLIGRVLPVGGEMIRGSGRVEASPGLIRVHEPITDLDGSLVLRYHFVPYLTTSPWVACEREYCEDDPVPFIRLRPPAGTRSVELEIRWPVAP